MRRMRGRAAACWLGGIVALGLAAGCNRVEHQPVPRPTGPSVVLVTIDTLRADHVGAYGAGFAQTPVLDALAREGTRFETAIAATPITLPSHASLLTGTWPPRHGVRHNGTFRLGEALPTLAERFRASGYATGAVVGAVVLGRRYGLARGFEHYDDHVGSRKAGATGFLERTATEVTDAALAWRASLGDRPFFLWVHYYDPHLEHRAPPSFAARFPDRPYDAEIAYVDHELGRLRDGLASQGAGETLWAVTADHGESLGDHGELNHGMTLYDAALHVPWILHGPGVPADRSVEGVVRAVDVAPTLLSLAGLPSLPDVDGRDLAPLLAPDAGPSPHWAYSESLLPKLDFGWAPLHAIRTRDLLYVRAPRPELYVLADDPDQQHDRASAPGSAGSIAELDARVESIIAEGGSDGRVELDPDERARLQALGYALPEGPVAETGLDPKDGLRFQGLVQEGARALVEQRYGDAEAALRAFLEHAPRSARAHGLLASTLLYTGRGPEALDHADRAIALDPRTAHRFADRAEIRLVLGDASGARADFEQAARLDPEDAFVQMGLMWIRLRDPEAPGALAAAAEHARRAFAYAPDDAFVRFRVGMLWREAGAYQAALESFRDAVRLRPDFALAQARLAVEYARIGRVEDARRHRALAGEWLHHPAVGSELAWALAAAGDPATGRAHLKELERRHPGDAHVARARRAIESLPDRRAHPEGT
jgi:arylsulfatase A-like enzyme/Flp pilus assembly protein TadD